MYVRATALQGERARTCLWLVNAEREQIQVYIYRIISMRQVIDKLVSRPDVTYDRCLVDRPLDRVARSWAVCVAATYLFYMSDIYAQHVWKALMKKKKKKKKKTYSRDSEVYLWYVSYVCMYVRIAQWQYVSIDRDMYSVFFDFCHIVSAR